MIRPSASLRAALLCAVVLSGAGLAMRGRNAASSLQGQHKTALSARRGAPAPIISRASGPRTPSPLRPASTKAAQILAGAKAQIGTVYDASYQTIAYPGGDVKADRGACTDVVIRALRNAGYDLQRLIHQDMKGERRAYPLRQGSRLDPNIDHRRVPNQMVYFRRHGQSLPLDTKGAHLTTWQPGDIVAWNLKSDGGTLLHTGIVSDARNAKGQPFVVHNLSVCAEEDALATWKIIGHFRFPASRQ